MSVESTGGGDSARSSGRRGLSLPRVAYVLIWFVIGTAAWLIITHVLTSEPFGEESWQRPSVLREYCGSRVGQADAPVKVVAILPVSAGCQDAIGIYLATVAVDHGEWVTTRVLDMRSDAGREEMSANNIRCACVIINGKTAFDLGDDGGKVLLEGPMDPRDVRGALVHSLRVACGRLPFTPPRAPSAPVPRARGRGPVAGSR